MTRKEVEKLVAHHKALARELLVRDGYHDLIAQVFSGTGPKTASFGPALAGIEELYRRGEVAAALRGKQAMWEQLRTLCQQEKAWGLLWIGEAWVAVAAPGTVQVMGGDEPGRAVAIGPIARFDPKRREVLTVTWEFRLEGEEKKYVGTWTQYFRHEGERILLEEVSETFKLASDGLANSFIE